MRWSHKQFSPRNGRITKEKFLSQKMWYTTFCRSAALSKWLCKIEWTGMSYSTHGAEKKTSTAAQLVLQCGDRATKHFPDCNEYWRGELWSAHQSSFSAKMEQSGKECDWNEVEQPGFAVDAWWTFLCGPAFFSGLVTKRMGFSAPPLKSNLCHTHQNDRWWFKLCGLLHTCELCCKSMTWWRLIAAKPLLRRNLGGRARQRLLLVWRWLQWAWKTTRSWSPNCSTTKEQHPQQWCQKRPSCHCLPLSTLGEEERWRKHKQASWLIWPPNLTLTTQSARARLIVG